MENVPCMKIFTTMSFLIKTWERLDKLWNSWANKGIL